MAVLLLSMALAPTRVLAQTAPTPEWVLEAPDTTLRFRTTPAAISSALAPVSGVMDVVVRTRMDDGGAHRLLEATSSELRLGGVRLGTMRATLFTTAQAPTSSVQVNLDGALVEASLRAVVPLRPDFSVPTLGWQPGALEVDVFVKDLDLGALSNALPRLALAGTADGRLGLRGRTDALEASAELFGRELVWRGESVGRVAFDWKHTGDVSTLRGIWGEDEAAIATLDATVPLAIDVHAGDVTWLDRKPHAVSLKAPALTTALLRPLWHLPPGVDLDVALEVAAKGTLDAPDATVQVSGAYRTDGQSYPLKGTVALADTQQVSLSLGGAVALELEAKAPLAAARRRGARLEPASLKGSLTLDAPLPALRPWLWRGIANPVGMLRGSVQIGGTLGAPTFDGALDVEQGRMTLTSLNRRLRDVTLKLALAKDTATLEEFRGDTTPGELKGHGTIRLVATPERHGGGLWGAWTVSAAMAFEAVSLPLVQDGLPLGTAEAKVGVAVTAKPRDTAVVVKVEGGEVTLRDEDLPKTSAIPTNRSVRVLDWLGRRSGEQSALAGDGRLRLVIELQDPVPIHGPDAEVKLGGTLALDRQGKIAHVDGGFSVEEGGTYELYENEMKLVAGVLTLAEGRVGAPPPQPGEAAPLEWALEVVSRGEVVDTDVLVKVIGPMRQPELILASSPPLPEYQIMTLLITGRVDTVDDRGGNVRKEVARLVSRYHNPSLKKQLFDRLGVDKLGLKFGSSVKNPILTVGKQINRQLYVETIYHHDAPPDTNEKEGHVEYRLGSAWTFDTVVGDRGEGRLGIFWATRFGGAEPPPPPPDTWGVTGVAKRRADDDNDGVQNAWDLCRDRQEDEDGFTDDDGCPDPDNDDDGVADADDANPNEAETPNGFEDGDGSPDEAPSVLIGIEGAAPTLEFRRGATQPGRDARAALEAIAATVGTWPDVGIEIVGHSDDRGRERTNQRISERRAESIQRQLVRLGLAEDRIRASGRGANEPIDTSGTAEARAKNRRATIRFVPPTAPPATEPAPE